MILAFYAIAVDLCYHVYKGHIWWYFPIMKKKKLTSAKKLKRGYKNRSNKITKRRGLILWVVEGGGGMVGVRVDSL